MYLFRRNTFKKGKVTGRGGESHLPLSGLCRQIEHLLVTSKMNFLRTAGGSEARAGWGGVGRRCPPV